MVFSEILPTITKPNVVISFLQSHLPNTTIGAMSVATVDSSALLNPDQKYPSTLTSIHIALQKILCINFGGELSTLATLMFVVLLNNFALLNPVQSYHLHARQYTTMHHFAMRNHITLKSL